MASNTKDKNPLILNTKPKSNNKEEMTSENPERRIPFEYKAELFYSKEPHKSFRVIDTVLML